MFGFHRKTSWFKERNLNFLLRTARTASVSLLVHVDHLQRFTFLSITISLFTESVWFSVPPGQVICSALSPFLLLHGFCHLSVCVLNVLVSDTLPGLLPFWVLHYRFLKWSVRWPAWSRRVLLQSQPTCSQWLKRTPEESRALFLWGS